MNVLIVEDEIMAQKSLTRTLKQNFPDLEIIGTTDSVKNTVEWLQTNQPDLIFMDIELSDGICFEIFRQTEVKAKVIMTTAYDSYALKAFEAGSVDYLLKPIDVTDLQRAVGRCRTRENNINIETFDSIVLFSDHTVLFKRSDKCCKHILIFHCHSRVYLKLASV